MVSQKEIETQLKRIGFNPNAWGRHEVQELAHIILPDEEIYECVNGIYEGGFALLVSTDIRVLLVDKKPLNYLTVEDLRFDMISEMDYSHRLLGARISISAGDKNLRFLSYNQPRLRKLIGHVQHCMAELKKQQSTHQEGQVQHLEKINQQLQAYLIAQHQQQLQLEELRKAQKDRSEPLPEPEPIRPGPELSDFLFAQSLLSQHQAQTGRTDLPIEGEVINRIALPATPTAPSPPARPAPPPEPQVSQMKELYAEGMKEIFGRHAQQNDTGGPPEAPATNPDAREPSTQAPLEINPIHVAYSKLPTALRNRKFGLPNFHPKIRPEAIRQPAPSQPAKV